MSGNEDESASSVGLRREMRAADDNAQRVRDAVRASLLDAYILSRNLTGESVATANDIGKLDMFFKHLTGERVSFEAA